MGDRRRVMRRVFRWSVMIESLLKRSRDIFEAPRRLPPKREMDHAIIIREGQQLVNVCPYKYGYKQKEEIEKLVE